jgi:hypothetical protein
MANRFKMLAQSTFGTGNKKFRGNTWARYSSNYAARVGSFVPTLLRTGKLRASIRVGTIRNNKIYVSADRPYAARQFLGSGKLPSRKFFPMEGVGSSWRLTSAGDVEMRRILLNELYTMSGGVLFQPKGVNLRSRYNMGNPLNNL